MAIAVSRPRIAGFRQRISKEMRGRPDCGRRRSLNATATVARRCADDCRTRRSNWRSSRRSPFLNRAEPRQGHRYFDCRRKCSLTFSPYASRSMRERGSLSPSTSRSPSIHATRATSLRWSANWRRRPLNSGMSICPTSRPTIRNTGRGSTAFSDQFVRADRSGAGEEGAAADRVTLSRPGRPGLMIAGSPMSPSARVPASATSSSARFLAPGECESSPRACRLPRTPCLTPRLILAGLASVRRRMR